MSNSLAIPEPKTDLTDIDKSIKQLRKVVDSDEEAELVEITRNLAIDLAKGVKRKMSKISERQDNGEDVDGRVFSSVSTALEKVTRAIDSLHKRKKDKVEEATAIVNAEIDKVKLKRGSENITDLTRFIFPFQGINRPTASPVIGALNEANVKVTDAIDAEMEEITDDSLDEFNKIQQNGVSHADSTSDANALPSILA